MPVTLAIAESDYADIAGTKGVTFQCNITRVIRRPTKWLSCFPEKAVKHAVFDATLAHGVTHTTSLDVQTRSDPDVNERSTWFPCRPFFVLPIKSPCFRVGRHRVAFFVSWPRSLPRVMRSGYAIGLCDREQNGLLGPFS